MAETSTYKSGHTGQQIDTAVNKVSDSSLNPSKEGHLITLDSSGNLKASDKTISNIETLESDVSRIDTAQTNLGNTVESLEDDLEDISGRVNLLNNRVSTLEGQVADQEENLRIFGIGLANVSRDIADLQNRVSLLEAQTLPTDVRVIYENDELNEGE